MEQSEKMAKYYAKCEERNRRRSERAKKISARPEIREAHSKRMKEFNSQPEIREMLSERKKRWWNNPENRKTQIEKRIKYFREHPEFKEASRKRLTEFLNRPEQKEKSSNRARAWWAAYPEAREKQRRRMMQAPVHRPSKPQLEIWNIVRQHYPSAVIEYPVAKRFLDVAIPELKIDIEYDGAFWHQNTAKDKSRDAILRKYGWVVVRIKENSPFDINIIHNLAKFRRICCHEDSLSRRA